MAGRPVPGHGVPWAAVRAVARVELRTRWRSMVVVGLLAGLVAGVVAAAAAVATRTATAYDRLAAASHLDDGRVLIFADSVRPDEVERLPGVVKSWRSSQVIGQVLGAPVVQYVSVSSGPPRDPDLFSPVLVQGRAPRDDAPFEVMVPEILAHENGVHLGEVVPVKLLTPLEVTQFGVGFGQPDGPKVDLTVVGIFRTSRYWVGNGVGPIVGSAALRQAAASSFVGQDVMVRLRHGKADAPAFARAVGRLDRRAATGATGQEFGTLQSALPTSDGDPEEVAARHTLVDGLLVLLVVALVGGLLAVTQALARHHGLGAADQQLEAELGLTRAERVLARLLPALVGAAIAGVLAAAGGLAAGAVEPLGPLKSYEPHPGYLAAPLVVGLAAAIAVVTFLVLSAVTAARVVRGPATATVGAGSLTPLPRLGRRAPALAGLAFALRRPGGRSAVPVRVTALVAVFGIAGVVAVGTFAASLDRLVHTPARYGWVADFATVDAKAQDTAAIAADPRVTAVTVGDGGSVRINDVVTTGVALRRVSGRSPIPLLSGRLPHRPGEIALGRVDLDRMGAQVGDFVALATVSGGEGAGSRAGSRPLRVVGTVVIPSISDTPLGTGAIMTRPDLRVGHRGQLNADALVTVRTERDAAALYGELSQRLEMTPSSVPGQVGNLAALGRLPAVLAGFLALLALVVLAHSLLLTTRRRSPDLAVLRVLGMSPRQVAAAVGVMAGTLAVIGLLLGPLLGVAVGRVVWAEVAANIGVAGDIAVPWWLALVVPAALLLTAAVAVLPARRAARLSPARVLRSE